MEASKWHDQTFILEKHGFLVEHQLQIGKLEQRKLFGELWLPIDWGRGGKSVLDQSGREWGEESGFGRHL